MKTTLTIIIMAGLASGAVAQLQTAENVAKTTARKTKEAAETVAHGAKKAVDTVADAVTPDSDAKRVDVTVNDDKIDMPTKLERGKTAFVVKNDGKATQNFEIEGSDIDRKFANPPNPGETKVLQATLKKGTYTIYSKDKDDKETRKVTLRVH